MKKTLSYFVLFLVSLFIISCNKENDGNLEGTNAVKGKYKIEVTQTGDVKDFDIDTSISGGNGLFNGIYDEDGNDLGMNYTLSESESKRNFYAYETAEDGIMFIFVQLATCEDLSKSMTTEINVYFNGKLFDSVKRTFKGDDTSPFSKHWTQVKE